MWKTPIFERLRLKKRVKNVTPKKNRIWLLYFVRVVAGVVLSPASGCIMGSIPDPVILNSRASGQIVGSISTGIVF